MIIGTSHELSHDRVVDYFDDLCREAKLHGYIVRQGYPTHEGKIQLTVGTKFIQFVSLLIKPSEIQIASQILIDTFKEQEIWK